LKKCLSDYDEDPFHDIQNATNEAQLEELVNAAAREVEPAHAITYDSYNLCDMYSSSKLKDFSFITLILFCLGFF